MKPTEITYIFSQFEVGLVLITAARHRFSNSLNRAGGLNTILSKDIPTFDVLMMVEESAV